MAPPAEPFGTYPGAPAAGMLLHMKTKQHLNRSLGTRRGHACALSALSALIVPALAFAGDLTIEVSGIAPDRGRIYVAVYDRAETFPTPGRLLVGQILDPSDRHLTVHFTFQGSAPGPVCRRRVSGREWERQVG
jgi:hypothetical protein